MFIRFDRIYERDGHTDRRTDGHRMTTGQHRAAKMLQEAQLSQRDRAMLGVTEYFAKSLKVIRNGILEKGVNPY